MVRASRLSRNNSADLAFGQACLSAAAIDRAARIWRVIGMSDPADLLSYMFDLPGAARPAPSEML